MSHLIEEVRADSRIVLPLSPKVCARLVGTSTDGEAFTVPPSGSGGATE